MKKWNEYKLILFDMDGTLYYQRPVQVCMGLQLLWNALFHRSGMKEFKTTMQYRKLREEWPAGVDSGMEDAQFEKLARVMKISVQQARDIIDKWIYTRPLNILPMFRDKFLIQTIEQLKKRNGSIVIYSDYPATKKAEVLGLQEIPCFYGGQRDIGCMKPSPAGIERIVQEYSLTCNGDILLVGDRMSRDGQAAQAAGIDYLILKKNRFQRKKQYRDIIDL